MELNETIRALRREKKLTQEQLAEAIGVSGASVSKWENGQCVPDLTVLTELADFFEVSVDAMLGHVLNPKTMEALLTRMDALCTAGQYRQAEEQAEKVLRRYPNSERAVERVANLYYNLFLFTQEKTSMEKAIELTNRLFALSEDETGTRRFALLSRLANQYELLEDWDMARNYYEKGNVCGLNNRALARCLANAGKNPEAVMAVSDVFSASLFELISDAILLEQIWQKLGCPEKGAAALRWGCAVLEAAGEETTASFSALAVAMYVELAKLEEEQGNRAAADERIRAAVEMTKNGGIRTGQPEFLQPSRAEVVVTGPQGSLELIEAWLDKPETARLLALVRREAGK